MPMHAVLNLKCWWLISDLIHLSMHAAGAPSNDLIDSDKQTVSDLADFALHGLDELGNCC